MDDLHQTGIAGSTPDYHTASLWSLVLLATDIPHHVHQRERNWHILVSPEQEEAARTQLTSFEEENRDWPPQEARRRERFSLAPESHPPTVLLMGGLLVFHAVTGPWSGQNAWFSRGAVDAGRILGEGEWWRLITALTLHADPVHLLGNLLIGGLLVHFLCKRLGSGLGWFLILAAGVLGNLVNVFLRGEHHSVGFSTAVFGTVGLLSGLQIHRGAGLSKGMLLPLGAALALLAFLGTEGERTDLGAHLWGLAAGLLLGLFAHIPFLSRELSARRWQNALLLVSLLTVALGWMLAWQVR